MPENKKRQEYAIIVAVIGFLAGLLGFKGFFTHDPMDLLYFCFFFALLFLREIDKKLGALGGLLGVIGLIVALLAIRGRIII